MPETQVLILQVTMLILANIHLSKIVDRWVNAVIALGYIVLWILLFILN